MSDFEISVADRNGKDESRLATDVLGIETITPEDVLLAQEAVENVRCSKCNETKDISEFSENLHMQVPMRACKACFVPPRKKKRAKPS